MSDILKYKGYAGSIHFDADDLMFYGKIEYIRALITYEADNALELKKSFELAVDDYLLVCQQQNLEPEQPTQKIL